MRKTKGFIGGILLLFVCHAIACVAVMAIGSIFFENFEYIVFFLSWLLWMHGWQLLYALPLYFWLVKRNKLHMAKGVLMGVAITAGVVFYFWDGNIPPSAY